MPLIEKRELLLTLPTLFAPESFGAIARVENDIVRRSNFHTVIITYADYFLALLRLNFRKKFLSYI